VKHSPLAGDLQSPSFRSAEAVRAATTFRPLPVFGIDRLPRQHTRNMNIGYSQISRYFLTMVIESL
jgi:hypothetical protein